MKIPCAPDCPRRSATCHGSCPDYAAYVAWRKEVRENRQRDVNAASTAIEGFNRRNPSNKRKGNRKTWGEI